LDHPGRQRRVVAALRFNSWLTWGGAADTQYSGSGASVTLVEHVTLIEFARGLSYKLNTNLSFYAQTGYEFAISQKDAQRDGARDDIGLRYTW
jgi:predicted porin